MNYKVKCPCESGRIYGDCCASYIEEGNTVPTAEALMRSRYTAFTQNNADYLLNSWHSKERPAASELRLNSDTKWLGLTIKRTEDGNEGDTSGIVEFIARYKGPNGKAVRLHEVSSFERENGKWVYTTGIHPSK